MRKLKSRRVDLANIQRSILLIQAEDQHRSAGEDPRNEGEDENY